MSVTHTHTHTLQALSLLQQARRIDRQAVPVYESSKARSEPHTHTHAGCEMEKESERNHQTSAHTEKKEKSDFKGH